jgi:2-succinyl-5-enolpyruvyl-6-hydroxy-3-cyclohexene-1-carboxylate synthase
VSLGDVSLACAWALVDELVASGLRHACLSPGSRSTPLALALARHPDVELHVHLDERSSAFFALGIAKSTLRPVAVACTSGTAAAELFPAVVEASQSRLPLVLLTADRPPSLRGTGANQTIDQVGLYGRYARAYLEPPVPSELGDAEAWREAGRDAAEAMHPVPGPVHVNCPFDEPLTPSETSQFQTSGERSRPSRRALEATPDEIDRFLELVSGARGVALFGGRPTIDDRPARFWSEVLGWPLIAEPTSSARRPGIALAAGQALLGSRWLDDLRPEVVAQFGAAPTTRASQGLVASAPELLVVDRLHLEPDLGSRATLRLHLDPGELSFDDRLPMPAPAEWTDTWRRDDGLARNAMDAYLDGLEEPFEPRIARDLAARVPEGGTLFVGNSSPVRDLDLAMAPREGLRVLANRGASGIDGLVSTALGIAAAEHGPTFALIGDLSFVHDAGGLLWSSKRGIALTIVVLNNTGGQLFAQLPQRALAEHEQLFLTPHGLDLGAMCAAAGVEHERVERSSDLIPALARTKESGGIAVVDVTIDVERQRHRREELGSAIDAALASEG